MEITQQFLIFKIKIYFEIPFEDFPTTHLQLDNCSIKICKDFINNLYVALCLKLFLAMNSKPCEKIYFSEIYRVFWEFSEIHQHVNYLSLNALLHIFW